MAGKQILNTKKIACIVILIFTIFVGCSGNYGDFKPRPDNESKETQNEWIDSWADYEIWLAYRKAQVAVIIFDWKHDDRTILAESNSRKVKDLNTWKKIVKAHTTGDGNFKLPGEYPAGISSVQGIWGPDDQLYGLIVYQAYSVSLGSVKLVDDNTIRLSLQPPAAVTNR